jgi:hypothetical protein
MKCAGYTLQDATTARDAADGLSRFEIRRGSAVVRVFTDATFTQASCVDVTGDASPELIVETYSGGAHCCSTVQVFMLQPSFRRLLNYPAGNADGFEVRRGPNGRPALALGDDGLAYYDDLCYACSPADVPLVACYAGTRFSDCTRQFPELVRRAIDDSVRQLKEAARSTEVSRIVFMRGPVLGVYAGYALLGREADGLAAVRRIAPEPQVTAWLARQRQGIMKWMGARSARVHP